MVWPKWRVAPACRWAVEAAGGMFGFVFSADGPIRRFAQVTAANTELFRQFFHGMLESDVYFAPSAFEAGFVSDAHGDEEISETLSRAKRVFATLNIVTSPDITPLRKCRPDQVAFLRAANRIKHFSDKVQALYRVVRFQAGLLLLRADRQNLGEAVTDQPAGIVVLPVQ